MLQPGSSSLKVHINITFRLPPPQRLRARLSCRQILSLGRDPSNFLPSLPRLHRAAQIRNAAAHLRQFESHPHRRRGHEDIRGHGCRGEAAEG